MRSTSRLGSVALLLLPVFLNAPASQVLASPLFPAIVASRSANGEFLVIVRRHLQEPNAISDEVSGAIFEIVRIEPSISEDYGLHSSFSFYTNTSYTSWQVQVTGTQSALKLPLVSDDGRYLVLLDVSSPSPTQTVLSIYQKHEHLGVEVRSYTLENLWTERELYPQGKKDTLFSDNGSKARWFSGDTVEFASNERTLLYTTKWHDRLSLELTDGSISRLPLAKSR